MPTERGASREEIGPFARRFTARRHVTRCRPSVRGAPTFCARTRMRRHSLGYG